MYTCSICNLDFNSVYSLSGHKRIHNSDQGKLHQPECCCIITKKIIVAYKLEKFQTNLKNCKYCNNVLDSNRKFCNNSCAAKFNNIKRSENGFSPSQEHRDKTSETIKISNTLSDKIVIGKYSKVYFKNCSICNQPFTINHKDKNKCIRCKNIKNSYRKTYEFTFNVKDYPDLFDLEYINNIGWYSPRKTMNRNLNGLTRDHIISAKEAYINNYDKFYITHPLNCKIMTQSENSSKQSKSELTYEELVNLVNLYRGIKYIV